jgi:hypothetical protein
LPSKFTLLLTAALASAAAAPIAACSANSDDAVLTCQDAPRTRPTSGGESFVAFERDFQCFTAWESFDIGESAPDIANLHSAGKRVAYVSQRPPKGSTVFPVGTIITKVAMADHDPLDWQIFAMVKRGGGFNDLGGGWEWFELRQSATGQSTIVWRGLGPPIGEGYSAQGASCNDCHGEMAKGNDFVQGPPLQLSSLTQP